jgi:hypothetical protein
MASNGCCFEVTWTIFKNPPLGGRLDTKLGEHGTLKSHNHWFIRFYHAWGPRVNATSLKEHWIGWGPDMIWEVSWDGLWTHLLGPHNFMVMALGSCVQWPLDPHKNPTSYLHNLQTHGPNEFAWLYEPVLEKIKNHRWLKKIIKTWNGEWPLLVYSTSSTVQWFLCGPTMANSKSGDSKSVQW